MYIMVTVSDNNVMLYNWHLPRESHLSVLNNNRKISNWGDGCVNLVGPFHDACVYQILRLYTVLFINYTSIKLKNTLTHFFKNKNIWGSIYILGHPEQPQYDCHISILESQTRRGGEAHLPHHVQLTNQSRPPSQSHINRNAGVWLLAATYVNKASDSVTYVVDIKDSSVYIIWFVKILLFTFP